MCFFLLSLFALHNYETVFLNMVTKDKILEKKINYTIFALVHVHTR